jgi:formylglycine-generating enzyme required for sulfatase activity
MKKLKLLIIFSILFLSAHVHAANNRALRPVAQTVSNEQRVALVIGNSDYLNSPLANPVNDAHDMAAQLRNLGFQVIERTNLKTKQIGSTLREFRSKLSPGAVALVFYAGHGLQIKGDNFLPAVDADINSEEDVPNQSLSVKQIMDVLDESRTRLNLVFLDACRNNPYASRSFRSADRGLARVSAPSGTLISYATRPGSVAADGTGRNGLYTSKLLAQMASTAPIEQSLKRVVTAVKSASQGKQEPWMEGSIEGDFCFGGCADTAAPSQQIAYIPPSPPPVQVAVKSKEQIEDEYWEAIKDSNDLASLQQYLSDYPNGRYLGLAKIKIGKLKSAVAPVVQAVNRPAVRVEGEPEMIRIPGRNYELGKFEVTQGQWRAVMGNNPSDFTACGDNCPVENVSWDDIQIYLQKLNQKTGKNYRLPTEAEWEYACYGGKKTEYCGSNDINAVAWYRDNSGKATHSVGQKQANGYGLYDMSGNVWEWNQDWYDNTQKGRVLRGGSWYGGEIMANSVVRDYYTPAWRYNYFGFRLARTLP